jgi:hypothetical protein
MKNIIGFRFAGIGIMLAMIAVFSAAVMLLWNALMPPLFALPLLNYWQAAGLMLLSRILFGGLVHDMAGRGRMGYNRRLGYSNKLREKWMNMSEEERKEFVEKEKDFFNSHQRFSHFRELFDDKEKPERSGV